MNETGMLTITSAFDRQFNELEARINGAGKQPIHQERQKAMASFREMGIPGAKNEEYKYTNFGKSLNKAFDFSISPSPPTISKEIINNYLIPGLESNILVFINGVFSADQSTIISPENELIVKDFQQATVENSDEIASFFAKYADYNADAFTALNTALAEHGSFIHIPDNKVVKAPIALYFINDASQGKTYSQPRNLFVIGKNSQATFIETFNINGDQESFTNIVSEIVVHENAHGHYYKIQNNKQTAYHIGTTQVWQGRNSHFSAYTFTLSGAMIRNNLNIVIDAEGCEANMYGLYLLNGATHVDNHTVVDHKKPNSWSNELYKGILEDKSHGVFNGKVFVRPDAQKTNAFQSNKSILLSDTATINSKPQLEIWADDVKCSHGCTTGQLDQEALFYIQSRGVGKEYARVILLYAFAKEVLETVKVDALKSYLEEMIAERLHKDF